MHLLHVTPDEGPRQLMVTFAGLTSYLGINSAGVGSFANALPWGWCEVGIPHYPMWWRIFRETDLTGVRAVVDGTKSVQSESHVFSDGQGRIGNAEVTPERVVWLEDRDGFFVHTNHYLGEPYASRPDLPPFLADSMPRYERMRSLILERTGQVDVRDDAGIPRRPRGPPAVHLPPRESCRASGRPPRWWPCPSGASCTSARGTPARGSMSSTRSDAAPVPAPDQPDSHPRSGEVWDSRRRLQTTLGHRQPDRVCVDLGAYTASGSRRPPSPRSVAPSAARWTTG